MGSPRVFVAVVGAAIVGLALAFWIRTEMRQPEAISREATDAGMSVSDHVSMSRRPHETRRPADASVALEPSTTDVPLPTLLSGVVTHSGVGVPGLDVDVYRASGREVRHFDLPAARRRVQVATARTDARGEFSCAVPGGVTLFAQPSGREDLGRTCYADEYVHLHVEPLTVAEVEVVDRVTGLPLPGSDVYCWRNGVSLGLEHARSDDRGVALLLALSRGDWATLVTHEGYSPQDAALSVPPGQLRVELDRAETLALEVVERGTVTSIAGAELSTNWIFLGAAIADVEGRAQLDVERGGEPWTVFCRAPGYARTEVVLSGPATIELTPGGRVMGRLVDAAGQPIGAASVLALGNDIGGEGPQRVESVWTDTDSAGLFELSGLRVDLALFVLMTSPGRGSSLLEVPPASLAEPIDLGNVVLGDSLSISGTVTDSERRAAIGWDIELRRQAGMVAPLSDWELARSVVRTCHTDWRGAFHFADLGPGRYRVSVSRRGDPRLLQTDVVLDGSRRSTGLSFILERGFEFDVFVFGDGGNPVSGLLVGAASGDGAIDVLTRSDAEGRARFTGLPHGEYRLYVVNLASSHDKYCAKSVTVRIEGAGSAEFPVVQGLPVTGAVLHADGSAAAGAVLTFHGDCPFRIQEPLRAGEDGRFSVLLPAGCTVGTLAEGAQVVLDPMQARSNSGR